MNKLLPLMFAALMLVGCAETDPYKRLEPAPTPELDANQVAYAFDARWPRQFKCVQTVTIDFRVTTRTLVGYLAVQLPGRFRLQGMSEQGLKLFDIAWSGGELIEIFAAEEFDRKVLENVARDITRVFVATVGSCTGAYTTSLGIGVLFDAESHVRQDDIGTRASFSGRRGELKLVLVGENSAVDSYDYHQANRSLYRVDQYEWQDFDGLFAPSRIVLRERGIQSDGPPYKLTIDISELTVRDKPWPVRTFEAPEQDE